MYQAHVSMLNAAMRHEPDIFQRGVTFAFLSIRTQFVRVTEQMAQVEAAGSNARALWGYKRGAYDYLRKHKFELWQTVREATDSETAIAALTTIPGIGIVKAAFVCQMMGHDIGCLDTRNIQRLGLNPREWRTDGEARKQSAAFKRKVSRYVDATYGKAELLWDDWCADVANVYKVSAEEISRDHLVIIPPPRRPFYRKASAVPVVVRQDIPFAA
jgi:hypothetical protein